MIANNVVASGELVEATFGEAGRAAIPESPGPPSPARRWWAVHAYWVAAAAEHRAAGVDGDALAWLSGADELRMLVKLIEELIVDLDERTAAILDGD